MNFNPIRGKLVLPADCYDLAGFEWTEPVAVPSKPKRSFADFQKSVQTLEVLPEPVKFKSLAETLGELVSWVRGFKRSSISPLAVVFSK